MAPVVVIIIAVVVAMAVADIVVACRFSQCSVIQRVDASLAQGRPSVAEAKEAVAAMEQAARRSRQRCAALPRAAALGLRAGVRVGGGNGRCGGYG